MFIFCAIVSIILLIADIMGKINIHLALCFTPMYVYILGWLILWIAACVIPKDKEDN